MEAQQQNYYPHHHYLQQQEAAAAHEETGNNNINNNNNNNKPPSFVCRQNSTRWTPTTDQIRILKELYYNNGIRSPSAEQIQRISACLRQYGKIEGKNVFYWFQNHKARERQKKRLITTTSTRDHLNHITSSFHTNASNAAANRRSSQVVDHSILYNNNISSTPSGVVPCPSSSPAGVLSAVGHIGSSAYGSRAMEKSFRECSISPKDSSAGSLGQNPHINSVPCSYPFLGHIKSTDDEDETLEEEEEEEDDDDESPELETLPLFPMRGEDSSGYYTTTTTTNTTTTTTTTTSTSGWYRSNVDNSSFGGSARASLELNLNSYITGSRRSSHFY